MATIITDFKLNTEQEKALQIIEDRMYPYILLTGDAGTGKSTLIKRFIEDEKREGNNVIVSASTGFAASLLNGVTYYNAFHLYPGVENGDKKVFVSAELSNVDTIIIDEVSMITAEMFDLIFQMLMHIRDKYGKIIKLVLVGDFSQLPPISGKGYINMHWLFESNAFNNVLCIRLKTKVRQSDDSEFSEKLDLLRYRNGECIDYINNKSIKKVFQGYTFLCGKNDDAEAICKSMLSKLPGDEYKCDCEIIGGNLTNRLRRNLDVSQLEYSLLLKKGAHVRFTINDKSNRYCNGTDGIVEKIVTSKLDRNYVEKIYVRRTDDNQLVEVGRVCIQLDGTSDIYISQFPLRLSYAMTIHKSQGMTFDKINIIPAGWEPGQLYVALSRAKHIEDIYLSEPITYEMLKCDPRVIKFYNDTKFIEL